ncbi:amino acid adenylation domain-containing protein [[Clostridium] aminophilum]|uniref:amino acid adenylation domain-containing protein n=1 Tax=[Clostridium] aminophilum TaxID=1526 RepID=UPI003F9A9DD9
MKNIVEYLEATAQKYGSKTAIVEADGRSSTFQELWGSSVRIAHALSKDVKKGSPVLVCMDKSSECIESFLAVAGLGGIYIPVDTELPFERIQYIVTTVKAKIVLTRTKDNPPKELGDICKIIYVDELLESVKEYEYSEMPGGRNVMATDPLYMIFTSGSTGVPKGIITTHLALFSFIDEMGERFHFSSQDILSNQVPFYFDASTKDIYLTLKYGCTLFLLPKKLFMMPKQLIQFLNDNHVTRIIWSPSLLCIVAKMKTLKIIKPEYLKSIFFVGELMPTQQYNIWKANLPDVEYVNLYGSTEVTGSSMYYIIEREIDNEEVIPIGEPFGNVRVFLLDDENQLVEKRNQVGEICITGASLALGYYGQPDMTEKVYVQNPLNRNYRELIYRSGDIGKYNDRGELVYVCRKDYQIKRMGRRIELGDVEAAISSVEGVDRVCCIFNEEKQEIIAVVSSEIMLKDLIEQVKNKLPSYMMPSRYEFLPEFPLNANGKADRTKIKRMYLGGDLG